MSTFFDAAPLSKQPHWIPVRDFNKVHAESDWGKGGSGPSGFCYVWLERHDRQWRIPGVNAPQEVHIVRWACACGVCGRWNSRPEGAEEPLDEAVKVEALAHLESR